jgi:hypothetical protein
MFFVTVFSDGYSALRLDTLPIEESGFFTLSVAISAAFLGGSTPFADLEALRPRG